MLEYGKKEKGESPVVRTQLISDHDHSLSLSDNVSNNAKCGVWSIG